MSFWLGSVSFHLLLFWCLRYCNSASVCVCICVCVGSPPCCDGEPCVFEWTSEWCRRELSAPGRFTHGSKVEGEVPDEEQSKTRPQRRSGWMMKHHNSHKGGRRLQQRGAPNCLGLHAIGRQPSLWLPVQSPQSKRSHAQAFSWRTNHYRTPPLVLWY